ncbi:MAG TPA: ATP-binding protein, partial [Pseudorhodoferax sp.]|nr:ATP-binding protein [Pseudorhodoferax sp.]
CCTHAQATQVELVLHGTRHGVGLRVRDNGRGFDTRRVFEDGARGIGLRNMRERAESLGGALTIASGRHGTSIETWLPLAQSVSSGASGASGPVRASASLSLVRPAP